MGESKEYMTLPEENGSINMPPSPWAPSGMWRACPAW